MFGPLVQIVRKETPYQEFSSSKLGVTHSNLFTLPFSQFTLQFQGLGIYKKNLYNFFSYNFFFFYDFYLFIFFSFQATNWLLNPFLFKEMFYIFLFVSDCDIEGYGE